MIDYLDDDKSIHLVSKRAVVSSVIVRLAFYTRAHLMSYWSATDVESSSIGTTPTLSRSFLLLSQTSFVAVAHIFIEKLTLHRCLPHHMRVLHEEQLHD